MFDILKIEETKIYDFNKKPCINHNFKSRGIVIIENEYYLEKLIL